MKFGEKYNIHGYKHNGDLYKVWDETIFLAQTDDYYVFANNKIMNYPDEIDKIVKYELNRLIEKYKRREDPFNEETIKKYYDLYKKLK